jgi:hypothetical protein
VTLPKTIRVYQTPSVCSEILNTREELERHAAAGYLPLPEDRHLAANAEPSKPAEPPTNTEGLRLDGPTLEEYVKAGYKAENYPPKGYAAKPSSEGAVTPKPETDAQADQQPPAAPNQPEAPATQPPASVPAPVVEKAAEKPAGKPGKPPQG